MLKNLVFRRRHGWLALLAGPALAGCALFLDADQDGVVYCGSETMQPGDVCRHKGTFSEDYSYERQHSENHGVQLMILCGAPVVSLAGIGILTGFIGRRPDPADVPSPGYYTYPPGVQPPPPRPQGPQSYTYPASPQQWTYPSPPQPHGRPPTQQPAPPQPTGWSEPQ